jgi:hypothetical protein
MTPKDFRLSRLSLEYPLTAGAELALSKCLTECWPDWPEKRQARLMSEVVNALGRYGQGATGPDMAPAELQQRFKSAGAQARKMLAALDKIPPVAWGLVDANALMDEPMMRARVERLAADLERGAASVPIDPHVQPSRTAARQLCVAIAQAYAEIVHEAPSEKVFLEFMRKVGKCAAVPIGIDAVRAGIRKSQRG